MSEVKKRRPECRVFVGNLDYRVTSNDLRDVFSGFGDVVDVYFPRDPNRKPPWLPQRRPKNAPVNYGCAFVEFAVKEQAEQLLSLKGFTDSYGREIYISSSVKR